MWAFGRFPTRKAARDPDPGIAQARNTSVTFPIGLAKIPSIDVEEKEEQLNYLLVCVMCLFCFLWEVVSPSSFLKLAKFVLILWKH